MCVYIYIYMYTYMYIYIYIYVYVYTHIHYMNVCHLAGGHRHRFFRRARHGMRGAVGTGLNCTENMCIYIYIYTMYNTYTHICICIYVV